LVVVVLVADLEEVVLVVDSEAVAPLAVEQGGNFN
jgi:hypothetical protein